MAKIENTTAYPTVTPAASDLLIATDVSNNNETVTFLVSSITGGSGVLQDLQSVLTTGNTAIEDINLTGNITVIGTVAPTTITALGSTGSAGQILSSTATGLQWINSPSTSCCTWNDSLISGNTSTTKAIVDGVPMEFINAGGLLSIQTPATLESSGINTFTGEVRINGTDINFNATGQINDGAGATGTAGQWLTSTGTGLAWSSTIPPSSCCNLQSTLNIGSTSLNQGMSFTGTSSITMAAGVSIGSSGDNVFSGTNTFNGVVEINDCLEDSLGTCGVAGQVLISTGSGVTWSAGSGLGAQNLQGVLDTGNSASGANASITITGTLNAATITDFSGATGAPGQILSMSGSGLTWITGAASGVSSFTNTNGTFVSASTTNTNATGAVSVGTIDLSATGVPSATTFLRGDNVWAVPAGAGGGVTDVALSPALFNTTAVVQGALINNVVGGTSTLTLLKYNGGSDIGMVPVGGTASTFLRGDGTWATGVGTGGVTDLSIGAVVSSTGLPIQISPASPATGSVTINQTRYTGDTNEGCVPRGSFGSASVYLDGSGNWSSPAGAGGVSSVTANLGVSTGTPITISPTTGAVIVTSNQYAGTTNVGHVPTGGGASTFLRGDGTWATPSSASAGGNFMETYVNRLNKYPAVTAGIYYAMNPYSNTSAYTPYEIYNTALTGSPAVTLPSAPQRWASSVFQVPADGCATGFPNLLLCSIATSAIFAPLDVNPTKMTIEVWKVTNGPCSNSDIYLITECVINVTTAKVPFCCDTSLMDATHSKLAPGDSIMLTWRTDESITSDSVYLGWKCTVRGEWVA